MTNVKPNTVRTCSVTKRNRFNAIIISLAVAVGLMVMPAHANAVPIPIKYYCYGNGDGYGAHVGIGLATSGHLDGSYQTIVQPGTAACGTYTQWAGAVVGPGYCVNYRYYEQGPNGEHWYRSIGTGTWRGGSYSWNHYPLFYSFRRGYDYDLWAYPCDTTNPA